MPPPQIVDGRTFIPLRAVFNVLGFADDNITWDGETRTATAVKDDLTITLTEGENTVTVTRGEETETQETDAAAYVDAATGRVLVPLRFVAQAVGCNVGWDGNTRTAIIDDTAAILAANTETYDLMDRYMAYSRSFSARNYNVTGDFTMDMTMGQDTVSVTGDYEMLTSATAADFTTNMIFAGQAEDQDMAAMFPNGLDFEMRFDMETGIYYLYSDALNEAAGTGATGVWYQMDLAAMMDQMGAQSGMDYSALMELSQAAQDMTFTEYLETMLASLPLTDASATTSDVLAVINDICADSAFQQSGAAYTSTYALGGGRGADADPVRQRRQCQRLCGGSIHGRPDGGQRQCARHQYDRQYVHECPHWRRGLRHDHDNGDDRAGMSLPPVPPWAFRPPARVSWI